MHEGALQGGCSARGTLAAEATDVPWLWPLNAPMRATGPGPVHTSPAALESVGHTRFSSGKAGRMCLCGSAMVAEAGGSLSAEETRAVTSDNAGCTVRHAHRSDAPVSPMGSGRVLRGRSRACARNRVCLCRNALQTPAHIVLVYHCILMQFACNNALHIPRMQLANFAVFPSFLCGSFTATPRVRDWQRACTG